ncbi:probable cysteine--tRNA ligase, mitochondrial isoform X2 [Teleopsis dalmanni]|uniref:probable cysteine--tRNA ligase, mitochondrial isoform X2 n=1 Tax=Teleopsis dalmanni TaxID=139649 RepID=UPI0018CFD3A4|nr:probable cysteine--tRNA ligase, mitochondrial isoform X2 [Teleopsis dalmanni]
MSKLSILPSQRFWITIKSIGHKRCLHTTNKYQQEHNYINWVKPSIGQDSGLQIYNCVAKKNVPLIFPSTDYITWYTCGPTVYDSAHLGHASCYVKLDIIQRIIRDYFKLNLVTAMNITDIDDKIIAKSKETGVNWQEIARFYETEYWADMKKLNVSEPNLKIRVTEHMPKIIAFIENVIAKDYAYCGDDKSVYFKVQNFPYYGKLQKLNLTAVETTVTPTTVGAVNKMSITDFALWKAQKTPDEPAWAAPWSNGRPGWHIECSVLASFLFGNKIDFHAGGVDLRFPHHENEEAQCCVYHNTKQWVNYWVHTGHLNVKGQTEKMSKSLKNTISIAEMLSVYTADEFRMACALSNYRNAMEYGDELMQTARATLNKFKDFDKDCQAYLQGKKKSVNLDGIEILKNLSHVKRQVDEAIKNDFDTSHVIQLLLEHNTNISRVINSGTDTGLTTTSCLDTIAAVSNYMQQILRTFGFAFTMQNAADSVISDCHVNVNELLEDLLRSRKIIRDRAIATKNNKLFEICDELRNCLQSHGIEIRDHSNGSSWNFTGNKK